MFIFLTVSVADSVLHNVFFLKSEFENYNKKQDDIGKQEMYKL